MERKFEADQNLRDKRCEEKCRGSWSQATFCSWYMNGVLAWYDCNACNVHYVHYVHNLCVWLCVWVCLCVCVSLSVCVCLCVGVCVFLCVGCVIVFVFFVCVHKGVCLWSVGVWYCVLVWVCMTIVWISLANVRVSLCDSLCECVSLCICDCHCLCMSMSECVCVYVRRFSR